MLNVFVEPLMTSSLSSFAKYKNVYVSLKLKNIFQRETPFFFTFYLLRRKAVFPKSANKDTLIVYNIPFESH